MRDRHERVVITGVLGRTFALAVLCSSACAGHSNHGDESEPTARRGA